MKKFIARILPLVFLATMLAGLLAGCGKTAVELALPDPLPEGVLSVELQADGGTRVEEDGKVWYEGANEIYLDIWCLYTYMPYEVTVTLGKQREFSYGLERVAETETSDGENGQLCHCYRTAALKVGSGKQTFTAEFTTVPAEYNLAFGFLWGDGGNSEGSEPTFDGVTEDLNQISFALTTDINCNPLNSWNPNGNRRWPAFHDEFSDGRQMRVKIAAKPAFTAKIPKTLVTDIERCKNDLTNLFVLQARSKDGEGNDSYSTLGDMTGYRTVTVSADEDTAFTLQWEFKNIDRDSRIGIDEDVLLAFLQSLQTPAA